MFGAIAVAFALSMLAAPAAADNALNCEFGDKIVDFGDGQDWSSVVLDTFRRLPSGYVPADLVSVRAAAIPGSSPIRAIVVADLMAMNSDARHDGVHLAVQSAYRSFHSQAATFRKWARKYGQRRALMTSARAGHSEHQLGTAIDFKSNGALEPWKVRNWDQTAEGRWLKANAWRYGFVLSYPDDAIDTVCYSFEPWHYRYFGREIAAQMHEAHQAPRVWLLTHPVPTPSPTPSPSPTASPIPTASPTPTDAATATPTDSPTPTDEPTLEPTAEPTTEPTAEPTAGPTEAASASPSPDESN